MKSDRDIAFLNEWSMLLSNTSSASELCRGLVHSNLTHPDTVGASIFSIDQQAHFQLVGSYGKGLPANGVSLWDEHPFARAVRAESMHSELGTTLDGSELEAYCLPLTKGGQPVGMLCLTLKAGEKWDLVSSGAISVISKITGIWLDSFSPSTRSTSPLATYAAVSNPESLTERQLTVLRLMAEGKTNAQIAQELILSESTIRQETVKIYRALGVHARSEAGRRAKHLGIIDRVAI